MQIQWYPGHMTKAKRAIQEDIRLVDLVIELTDARVIRSGRNPDIDKLATGKSRLILLNKADMADEAETAKWIASFKKKGIHAIALDARKNGFQKQLTAAIMEACKEKLERDKRRGILNRPIRGIVLGIPNVGKSTFINSFAKKTAAKTGNKPGVTKGNQWIHVEKQIDLLDTPGILWPKFEDPMVGLHLAMIGSINDEVINLEELAFEVLKYMAREYPTRLTERYGVDTTSEIIEQMAQIAKLRGCLKKGAEPDYEKTARLILDDFRSGRLGKVTLERVEQG